jgi:hypothetical protein
VFDGIVMEISKLYFDFNCFNSSLFVWLFILNAWEFCFGIKYEKGSLLLLSEEVLFIVVLNKESFDLSIMSMLSFPFINYINIKISIFIMMMV